MSDLWARVWNAIRPDAYHEVNADTITDLTTLLREAHVDIKNTRTAALEEAAMVAQRMADDNSLSGGEPWICEVVARDIRALKDKETTP